MGFAAGGRGTGQGFLMAWSWMGVPGALAAPNEPRDVPQALAALLPGLFLPHTCRWSALKLPPWELGVLALPGTLLEARQRNKRGC